MMSEEDSKILKEFIDRVHERFSDARFAHIIFSKNIKDKMEYKKIVSA